MVATSKTSARIRQQPRVHRQNSMSQFDADGRRQLLGLSQAIRKHAQQSTSPTTEFKYGRTANQQTLASKRTKPKVKTAPTIEDRLLSLLNSDTEGIEGQSASNATKVSFDKPPTFELGSKGLHGSYSPRLAESKMRMERLNRTTGDNPRNAVKIDPHRNPQRTRSLSSENVLKDCGLQVNTNPSSLNSSPPCVRRKRDVEESHNERIRRCVSAVPASFYDENWNVVPETPKREERFVGHVPVSPHTPPPQQACTMDRRAPNGAYNQAIWDQRPPPSPNRIMTLPRNSSVPHSPKQPRSAVSWTVQRPLTESRSIDTASCTRRALDYTPSSLPIARKGQGKFIFRIGSPATLPTSPIARSTSGSSTPVPQSPATLTRISSTLDRKPKPIQYVEPPSPACTRISSPTTKADISPANELKVSSLVITSTPKPPVPIPAKRTSYKKSPVVTPSESKIPSISNEKKVISHDDEPDSCKSEDRDSGAILDAEASVFDFDSSVISDSGDEASQRLLDRSSNKLQSEKQSEEQLWSRSSTPTLPPLSPFDSDVEPTEVISPDQSHDGHLADDISDSPIAKNEVPRLPTYDSLVRKKNAIGAEINASAKDAKGYMSGENHDHNELSPTESALAESCEKEKAPIETKNDFKVTTKIVANQIMKRRISRTSSRASSCDERRVVINPGRHRVSKRTSKHKSGNKRHQKPGEEYTHYDIEDIALSKKRLGRYPVFYRPGEEGVAASGHRDADETSSVRSFTSASVTSSVLRKHGRKHHRRHHTHSGSTEKTYAKEIRAVNKRFTRLEAHVVTLARSVAQLSSEVRRQVDTSRDIDELRTQVEELRKEKSTSSRKSSTSSFAKSENQKKANSSKGQPKRVVKLTKFFGEKPPILSMFLSRMGYEKYIDNFKAESIGMVELAYMDEERLKSIGIPLGPRLRILSEAKKTCLV